MSDKSIVSELQIEVVSDPVCPWCYIGKRRLEEALARFPELRTTVRWSPFQLSPDMPVEGKDRAAHYAEIFGAERAAEIRDNMAETARREGLEFAWKPGARAPNTLLAHVLMAIAGDTPGVDASAVAEALFHAHHVECADLGNIEVLLAIAMASGLAGDGLREALADPERQSRVQTGIRRSAARGITGVPCFIFDNRYAVSGAQPADALADLVRRLTD